MGPPVRWTLTLKRTCTAGGVSQPRVRRPQVAAGQVHSCTHVDGAGALGRSFLAALPSRCIRAAALRCGLAGPSWLVEPPPPHRLDCGFLLSASLAAFKHRMLGPIARRHCEWHSTGLLCDVENAFTLSNLFPTSEHEPGGVSSHHHVCQTIKR
jgi:hypothetical protein